MATEIISAVEYGEERVASTAGGGTALTTTAAFIRLPRITKAISIVPRNFATAVVAKYHLNPWLTILKTVDALATAPTDYSNAGQDLSAAAAGVVLSSLDTLANGDFILVGSRLPFRGVRCVANAANGTGSVLTVHYRKNDDTWADTSATDGTISGGATFAQTGNVTWTVPTDWKVASLGSIYTSSPMFAGRETPLYWTRWSVSVALDSSTTLDQMLAMNRNTARYAELVSGEAREHTIMHGREGGVGCIECLTDAGTANLVVNAYAKVGEGFV